MDRRALLAGSAAGLWAASARAQQACFDRMDCFDTKLPGPSLDLQFTSGTLDPRITFTRASVATYFDVAGVLQTAGTNVARFDYDPVTHAPRGLLIEEARTNLLLNSATLGTQSVTIAATPYTLSFYGSGTVTLTGTSTAGPLTGTGAFPQRVSLTFTPTAGTLTLTVSGSVLNANLEAGSFATSAIVTAGVTATRAADVATMPVAGWFNAAAGTLDVEGAAFLVGSSAAQYAFAALGTDSSNSYELRTVLGSATAQVGVFSTGTSRLQLAPSTTLTANNVVKLAAQYAGTAVSISVGGSAAISGTASPFPTLAALGIGYSYRAGGTSLNGTISRVRYWPRALGAGELQAVTR